MGKCLVVSSVSCFDFAQFLRVMAELRMTADAKIDKVEPLTLVWFCCCVR